MISTQEQITSILLKMRHSVLSTPIDSIDNLSQQYGIVFSGENGNIINSVEFCHMLNKQFSIDISHDSLVYMLPTICAAISMPITAVFSIDSVLNGSPSLSGYTIQL